MRGTGTRQRCRVLPARLWRGTARKRGQSSGGMKPENPAEPFKRAVGTAVRALAGEPELEVAFSAEPPALKGLKARLPLPTRNLPPNEVAVVRGQGDAYALRRAYHEDKLHEHYRPQTQD